MVLAVLGVVIQAETMNMQGIVVRQNAGEIFGWNGLGNPYLLTQVVGFVVFMPMPQITPVSCVCVFVAVQ